MWALGFRITRYSRKPPTREPVGEQQANPLVAGKRCNEDRTQYSYAEVDQGCPDATVPPIRSEHNGRANDYDYEGVSDRSRMQRASRLRTFYQTIHTPDQCRLNGRKAKLADNDLALVCQLQDEVPVLANDLRISLRTYRVDDIEYGGEQR